MPLGPVRYFVIRAIHSLLYTFVQSIYELNDWIILD